MEHGVMALFEALPQGMPGALLAVAAALSYLLGCLNGAVLISKYILRDDVRNHGSGNAGLTNFYRCFGGKLALAVIGIDMLKIIISVFLSWALFHVLLHEVPIFVHFWAGFWCTLGHMFPCMFRFHGGKGILTGGTLTLLLDWRIALLLWSVFLLTLILTKLVSLSSCIGAVLFPISTGVCYQTSSILLISILFSGLILWQHRGNIRRILRGEESRFSLRRKRARS